MTMIDFSKGWDDIKDRMDSLITSLHGEMSYFPLCCSTGVMKNVLAYRPAEHTQMSVYTGASKYTGDLPTKELIETTKTIWALLRLVQNHIYFIFPEEVGVWYCMSLILAKVSSGRDDHHSDGYSGYKASAITMFDRLLEDKQNKDFKFSYNTVFSIDHFQEWLAQFGSEYGDVYVSPAVPGAHKARVRGCIFTPNLTALQNYEKERIELLRTHMLMNYDFLESRAASTTTSTLNTKW